jgi:nucleoside-diphosphate-sugar epimerase
MRILVTGAMGLIGRQVVSDLAAHGHTVLPVDRRADPGVRGSGVDLLDPSAVARLPPCDAVVHLAAHPSLDGADERTVLVENVATAANVLLWAEAAGVERVVYGSSQSALGLPTARAVRPPDYLPVDEAHPCRPEDGYSFSKRFGEEFAAMLCRRSRVAVRCLRFPVVWDPEQHAECVARRLGLPAQGAKSLWAYIDVRDAARAVRLAATAEWTGYEVLNVTTAVPFADAPVAELVATWFPGLEDIRVALAADTPPFDCRAAAQSIGFRSQYVWTRDGVQGPPN